MNVLVIANNTRAGDILGGSDSPRRVAVGDVLEVIPLAVVAERVPGAGIDDPGRNRVDPYRSEFDGQPAGEEVDGAIGDTHPEIADVELEGVHAREQHERAARIDLRGKVFGQHGGADDLGVKRPLQVVALQVVQFSASAGRGGRHHVIDGAHPVGEGGDRLVVGEVDDLSGDIAAAVGAGELGLIASGRDDPRAFRLRQQSDRARDPAAAPDHHDGLVPQRVTHRAFTPP